MRSINNVSQKGGLTMITSSLGANKVLLTSMILISTATLALTLGRTKHRTDTSAWLHTIAYLSSRR